MKKSIVTLMSIIALMGLFSMHAMAQDNPTKKNENSTDQVETKKEGKPKASPGWVILEEDWWFPFRFDFSNSLHNARVHYLAREEKAAAAEIDKATSWLKFAESHAKNLSRTAEDLSSARADLNDFAAQLRNGTAVKAKKLAAAFAHASAALSQHHHYQSTKALAKGDLETAGRHLFAAANHLRDASRAANYEYGKEVVEFYNDYWPFGYWDETLVFDKNDLKSNLKTVASELEKLGAKAGAKKAK